MTRPGGPVDKKVNWKKEIALFFIISFMIWFTLFAIIYGGFLFVEFYSYNDSIALQILDIKWFFSLYFSILFSLEAWALGVYDLIAVYLERRNIIKHLNLVVDGIVLVSHQRSSGSIPTLSGQEGSR
ncbi:MAG: hypothetical protein KAR39_00145 [Thermoplasmata archaeon]|nr:hypothetical protein [Thermoplasmata archaeon]